MNVIAIILVGGENILCSAWLILFWHLFFFWLLRGIQN
jgi:hypothetical protein